MICLFLDTSSETLKVSLIKNSELIYDKELTNQKDHSSYLIPCINEAFKNNDIDFKSLDRIIVGIGPGSFTGTRISITAAKVFGYSLSIPIYPISSLEMLIYCIDDYDYYIPVIEDKNDKLYFGLYDKDKKKIIDDSYATYENFEKIIKKYNGKKVIISKNNIKYPNIECIKGNIDSVKISTNILINNQEINPHLLKPNYIKKIEAEEKL